MQRKIFQIFFSSTMADNLCKTGDFLKCCQVILTFIMTYFLNMSQECSKQTSFCLPLLLFFIIYNWANEQQKEISKTILRAFSKKSKINEMK